ncbi:MAG: ABC transporter substrate-binding protein, partial [Betaproteobacteria bacterium]|nr:ABC transporter substrate-binding protein [Betaproteobacteria bacterium]
MIQAGAATLGAASWGSLMAQPSAATTAALAALTGAERLKRLAEGAKKEGVVSIYTS